MAYKIAQLWDEDEKKWSNWMDLPIILNINEKIFSISWTEFDGPAIESGRVLLFSVVGSKVQWVSQGHRSLDLIIGEKIDSAFLGKGQMSIESSEIEIWTRVLVNLANGNTLEIYNSLDENAIEVFKTKQIPESVNCTK